LVNKLVSVDFAPLLEKLITSPSAKSLCQPYQALVSDVALTCQKSGFTPKPCPIVPAEPVPVYLDIENPAVVLTDVDVVFIEPSVLAEPAPPPAFQFHEQAVTPLAFNPADEPKVYPSAFHPVIPEVVPSTAVESEIKYFVVPLTASNK